MAQMLPTAPQIKCSDSSIPLRIGTEREKKNRNFWLEMLIENVSLITLLKSNFEIFGVAFIHGNPFFLSISLIRGKNFDMKFIISFNRK